VGRIDTEGYGCLAVNTDRVTSLASLVDGCLAATTIWTWHLLTRECCLAGHTALLYVVLRVASLGDGLVAAGRVAQGELLVPSTLASLLKPEPLGPAPGPRACGPAVR